MDRRKSLNRAGFTLVEVLVVILILATLIALLLPAVNAAINRAKEAQVTAEINNLATALASFRNTYGDYPPSRVILCETGFNSLSGLTGAVPSGGDDITYQQLIQRSRTYLRKFWPRADFDSDPTNGGSVTPGPLGFNDFDGNGSCGGPPGGQAYVILSGSECLTFFLGGLPVNNGNNSFGTSGFNRLPTSPFVNIQNAPNRTVPNYEFNISRLIDQDGDLFPSYVDPLDASVRRAYAYFASYGSNSYDPNDDNGNGHVNHVVTPEYEEDGSTIVARGFSLGFSTSSTTANYGVSPGPNPYCASAPVSTGGTVTWLNPNSFQLFSSGRDRYWGLGGIYNQGSLGATKLPITPNDPGIVNVGPSPAPNDFTDNIRSRESDNLSNFTTGRLD